MDVIPKQVTIGKTLYTVRLQGQLPYGDWGRCSPTLGLIEIATHPKAGLVRKMRGQKGLGVSFWHEVTHAILHDMGHPLWTNEKFVTDFSRRLGQLIETAKF